MRQTRAAAVASIFRINRLGHFAVIAALIAMTTNDGQSQTQQSSPQKSATVSAGNRPNVLMIVVDDLNDWVEPLGGHPQVKTPTISALANRGVTFTNAHCQSPLCNSSRTSVMLSMRPSSTGIYGLSPWYRKVDSLKQITSLPQHFSDHGYRTYTGGKVYHNSLGKNPGPGLRPEFDVWGPRGGPGIFPKQKLIPETPAGNNRLVDWGVFDHKDSQKGDYKVASWGEQQLAKMPEGKPFFMAVGFFMPHVPCHVTQKWWDMYPAKTLIMPEMKPKEREGCSPFSWRLHWNPPEPRLGWLQKHNQHENLVRSYLASVSFVDSQIKRVLDALDKSPHAKNTIVVLWTDHGYHLGEKEMTGKLTLWEPSTRVPLIIAGPGISAGECGEPVELLDIYPTLSDLANLDEPEHVEGQSLTSLVANPKLKTDRVAITEHNPGNIGIRDRQFRFIQYGDGSEELYDIANDPNEFHNLIDLPNHQQTAARLRKRIIQNPAKLAPESNGRVLEQKADGWYWEHKRIDPDTHRGFKK